MSRNMTAAQSNLRNAESFRRQLGVLHQAAIGVVLCRTREPFRAIDTMREFAFAERLDFRMWTITRGWASYDRTNPEADPTTDGMMEPLSALQKIGNDSEPNGIYAMMYPHKPLSANIAMLQLVKEYCRLFSETRKRLILITPHGFTLPQELEDDVVILDFDTPAYAEMRQSYDNLMQGVSDAKRPRFNEEQVDRILAAGAGMTAHEFENAVSRALVTLRGKLPNVAIDEFADIVMGVKVEVVKRSEVLEVMEADSIANIGGLENLKGWIRKRAHCFSQEARDAGVEAPKGIALIGPPGTGKSASAKAIASVLALPLIKFDVSRVFNSLVGQSEARVRSALKLLDGMAPAVVFLDEADKAFAGQASGGGGGDSGVGMRVLGAILTWMQETKAPVFMVVTANRTQNLPSEFLRRGRLDEVFSVTVPHEGERMDILRIHLRKRGRNPDEVEGLQEAVDRSAGYVPAELEAAVKDAIIESFTQKVPMTGALIAEQLSYMVPLSEAFKSDFEAMKLWAEQNARPASLPPGHEGELSRVRNRVRPTRPGGGRLMAGLDG
jgi:SpoVK/Ycf46/Vps4 family AAA+-type ATPase